MQGTDRAWKIAASPVDEEAFGYICRQCSRCCYDKTIQINPYEVSRLARTLQISSSELRERFTAGGRGEHLARKEDGSCVFLTESGCSVHEGRPLVCRLYPLGRTISADGSVTFSLLEGHPESDGSVTKEGTVAAYVEAQGAGPFIAAADGYFHWFCAAFESGADPDVGAEGPQAPAEDILDMDRATERFCAETGAMLPDDPDERLSLHLTLLHDLLKNRYA
jgi:uncharacterized protein